MSITNPEPTRLTLMDRAVIQYHSKSEDFLKLLDPYLSCFPESERYTFFGPNYILLGRRAEDDGGAYWHVDYAAGDGVKIFLQFIPYYLDRVGFHRYLKYSDHQVHFIKLDKLLRHYGIETEISPATSTASAASAAADPSGS